MKKLLVLLLIPFSLSLIPQSCEAQYDTLLNFTGANGSFPNGSLTLSGNTLYGMTSEGGGSGMGNIFSVKTNGSGYRDFMDFNGGNGAFPLGSS